MELYTASLYLRKDVERLDILLLDTTVKTGNPVFAPTWEMVMAHKRSQKTPEDDKIYEDQYYPMMRTSYRDHRTSWEWVLQQDRVAIGCYCHEGTFCHRHLLKDMFLMLAPRLGYTAVYKGEITRRGIVL